MTSIKSYLPGTSCGLEAVARFDNLNLGQIPDKGTEIVATIAAAANSNVANSKIGIGTTAYVRRLCVAVTKKQGRLLIFSGTHEDRCTGDARQGAGISNVIGMMV